MARPEMPTEIQTARDEAFAIAMDCRDAALLRDEALYRGVSEAELLRMGLNSMLVDIRKRKPSKCL